LPADETDRRFFIFFWSLFRLLACCLFKNSKQAGGLVLSTNEPLNFYNQGSQC